MRHQLFYIGLLSGCLSFLLGNNSLADQPKTNYQIKRDIEYARIDEHRLLLDLYLPKAVRNPPLLVWVHGGAWRAGSKNKMPLGELVNRGFAVASIDYRLSPVAPFPAQIHDCKAAIRFLRRKQKELAYDARKIGIAGSSAGGHLVALMGTTNGHKELEGNVGEHLQHSSDVQAVVDYYGPTNFLTILKQSTKHGLSVRIPALQLLLRSQPEENPKLATLASPVFHVDKTDPPLLLIHGDKDPQVPLKQSYELHEACKRKGVIVQLEVVPGGVHGGKEFHDTARTKLVEQFFRTHLHSK